MLSFKLTPKLTDRLQQVTEALTKAYLRVQDLSEDEQAALHRFARISMIGASTRIENALLTDVEVEWMDTILTQVARPTAFNSQRHLIENKLSKDRERSIEEVAGCRDMLHLIYQQSTELFPLTEITVRGFHHELLKYYAKAGPYVGVYKKLPNSVVEKNHKTGQSRTVFKTADPGPITKAAMRDLLAWHNEVLPEEKWSVAVACELVYRFLAIHPFQDGNGRLGRGLFLMALLQSTDETLKNIAPYLSIDRHIEKHKSEYYMVLQQCSKGEFKTDPRQYKIEYFLQFMLKILEESVTDITLNRKRFAAQNDLSEAAVKVYTCFKEHPEVRLTAKLIIAETSLPRRTVVYSLNTLLDAQLIQRFGKGAGVRYQLIF